MANETGTRERDLILAPNEYAYVQDNTKGEVLLYVGPCKVSMSNTERLVGFINGRFVVVSGENEGIQRFVEATTSQYVVLTNPAKDPNARHSKQSNPAVELLTGKKIVIPGPCSFPLWPGQVAQVINGHLLSEHEYLAVRVNDNCDVSDIPGLNPVSRAKISKAKSAEQIAEQIAKSPEQTTEEIEKSAEAELIVTKLPIGSIIIVRGRDCKSFIPKTGLEVLPDKSGIYVRSGTILRDDEFCITQDPRGEKEYHFGPMIVFPKPPELKLEVIPDEKNSLVRKGVALSTGEYCVLVDAVGKKRYCYGPAVVFPKEETKEEFLINQKPCFSDARIFRAYELKLNQGLLVRVTGSHTVKEGGATENQIPPGTYVAGQEIFIQGKCGFFFPSEYLEVVKEIAAIPISANEGIYVRNIATGEITTVKGPVNLLPDPTKNEIVTRRLSPELEKLYQIDGRDPQKAVRIKIPPSMAVLVTSHEQRRVVEGPTYAILGYDEELEIMELSTGTPKNDKLLKLTCFLLTQGNKVSDIITGSTSDQVRLEISVSYRVSFSAEAKEKWFNSKNYIVLLCEHLRSILRAVTKATPIDRMYKDGTTIVRDAILGVKVPDGNRKGKLFAENGMLVYDVEVLGITILDESVQEMLSNIETQVVTSDVRRREQRLLLNEQLDTFKLNEEKALAEAAYAQAKIEIELERKQRELEGERIKLDLSRQLQEERALTEKTLKDLEAEAELHRQGLLSKTTQVQNQTAREAEELRRQFALLALETGMLTRQAELDVHKAMEALEKAKMDLAKANSEATTECSRIIVIGNADSAAKAMAIGEAAKADAKQRLSEIDLNDAKERAAVEIDTLRARAEAEEKISLAQGEVVAKQISVITPQLAAALEALGQKTLISGIAENFNIQSLVKDMGIVEAATQILGSLPFGVELNGKDILIGARAIGAKKEKQDE